MKYGSMMHWSRTSSNTIKVPQSDFRVRFGIDLGLGLALTCDGVRPWGYGIHCDVCLCVCICGCVHVLLTLGAPIYSHFGDQPALRGENTSPNVSQSILG